MSAIRNFARLDGKWTVVISTAVAAACLCLGYVVPNPLFRGSSLAVCCIVYPAMLFVPPICRQWTRRISDSPL